MNKCDCYVEDRQLSDYTPLMKPIYKTVSLCFGTKERDRCSCGGDRTKCDFYPEVREKAKKELKKVITNGGYIRSMDNKELAAFLMSRWFIDDVCKNCEGEYDRCGDLKFCESKIYEWLLKTKK